VGNITDLANLATTHAEQWLFYLAAFVTFPLAFGVLLDRNIIRAGFLLIGVFGGISALFLLLQAQFIAMAQLMIYAVGITLVVVIALMLTNPNMESEKSTDLPEQKTPAFFTCALIFAVLYMCILSEAWPIEPTAVPDAANNITILGTALLKDYALPFEFSSILLLVALIGAVMLAKTDRVRPGSEAPDTDETGVAYAERNDHVVELK
jgi:NADH:ubiquinone oxidoreductase subunit 6 (subunit J)